MYLQVDNISRSIHIPDEETSFYFINLGSVPAVDMTIAREDVENIRRVTKLMSVKQSENEPFNHPPLIVKYCRSFLLLHHSSINYFGWSNKAKGFLVKRIG